MDGAREAVVIHLHGHCHLRGMAAADIHLWLVGPRDYHAGVQLLLQHTELDEATAFLLELGETAVSRETLVEELQALYRAAITRTEQRPTITTELVTKADIVAERSAMARDPRNDGYDMVQLPAELHELRNQAKDDLRELGYLRARLETLPSDADRYRDARRIVELDLAIASAYGRLDAHRDTGRDPGSANHQPTVIKSGVELAREHSNLVSYLARHNSGKRKASEEKAKQWTERKQELEALLATL